MNGPLVIPGRGEAANPKPMNTGGVNVAQPDVRRLARPVFMGSGPGPLAVPE